QTFCSNEFIKDTSVSINYTFKEDGQLTTIFSPIEWKKRPKDENDDPGLIGLLLDESSSVTIGQIIKELIWPSSIKYYVREEKSFFPPSLKGFKKLADGVIDSDF